MKSLIDKKINLLLDTQKEEYKDGILCTLLEINNNFIKIKIDDKILFINIQKILSIQEIN